VLVEFSDGRGVGETKNAGAKTIKRTSDWVMFSDDDMYWLQDYDQSLKYVMLNWSVITQLGAWSHPFNAVTDVQPRKPLVELTHGHVNAAHGGGFVMHWTDWDRHGPFLANATGPGKSEDWELSQRIIKAGGQVRCIQPFVALHCGITNCEGNPATGADHLREQIERQIKELKLEGVYYE